MQTAQLSESLAMTNLGSTDVLQDPLDGPHQGLSEGQYGSDFLVHNITVLLKLHLRVMG